MNYRTLTPQQTLILKDMQTALEYGSVKADRRLQVVMPSAVVEALDELFPELERSKVLTQLAINAILEKQAFGDRPELGELAAHDQAGLTTMLNYLEEREHQS